MDRIHTDRNGIKTPIKELSTRHLINIINQIHRLVKEGLDGELIGHTLSEWGVPENKPHTIYGGEVRIKKRLCDYTRELKRRQETENERI